MLICPSAVIFAYFFISYSFCEFEIYSNQINVIIRIMRANLYVYVIRNAYAAMVFPYEFVGSSHVDFSAIQFLPRAAVIDIEHICIGIDLAYKLYRM